MTPGNLTPLPAAGEGANQQMQGAPAAAGIGIGYSAPWRMAILYAAHGARSASQDAHANAEEEWRTFCRVQRQVDADLAEGEAAGNAEVAEVFAAHRLILHDETLVSVVRQGIFSERLSAPVATWEAVHALAEMLRDLDDAYFAERTNDVLDIGRRLLTQMGIAMAQTQPDALRADAILIADDLTPSEVAQLSVARVKGIALARGAPTAHAAVLARSLGIPLVCALGERVLRVPPDRRCIVDGNRGLLVLDADDEVVQHYTMLHQALLEERARAAARAHEVAHTRASDTTPATPIRVYANANSSADVQAVGASGAEGIGLLRTEYLFQGRATAPALAEQTQMYTSFLRELQRGMLTVRALDTGGDKPVAYINFAREENPFLGVRGVRLLLQQPALLQTQYRALLHAVRTVQAEAHGNQVVARFMLPMISTVQEVAQVRELLAAVHAEEAAQGNDLPPLPLGAMIEVPSAAIMADELAQVCDFFSIGTNDLAQYTMASDRMHRTVGALVDALDPAVLRLIQLTSAAGARATIPVALCGELAGNPVATPLLIGLGIRELSATLPAVGLVKAAVRRHTLEACNALAQSALASSSALQVHALLREFAHRETRKAVISNQ